MSDELIDFMESLGYKPETAVKDHRTVTRFTHPSADLQNISRHLAQHLLISVLANIKAKVEEPGL